MTLAAITPKLFFPLGFPGHLKTQQAITSCQDDGRSKARRQSYQTQEAVSTEQVLCMQDSPLAGVVEDVLPYLAFHRCGHRAPAPLPRPPDASLRIRQPKVPPISTTNYEEP